jgi:hypothetical protein
VAVLSHTGPTESRLKTCRTCGVEKPLTDFHRHREVYHQSNCKSCGAEIHRKWREANRERDRAYNKAWKTANHDRNLANDRLRDYGLTRGDFQQLWDDQDGACAICFAVLEFRSANVDHDHNTKAIRGLLCRECNLGLSNFKDDSDALIRAARYLRTGGDLNNPHGVDLAA